MYGVYIRFWPTLGMCGAVLQLCQILLVREYILILIAHYFACTRCSDRPFLREQTLPWPAVQTTQAAL
jgi:hypothetical protein